MDWRTTTLFSEFKELYSSLIGNEYEFFDVKNKVYRRGIVIDLVKDDECYIKFSSSEIEYLCNENFINYDNEPFWLRQETKTDCRKEMSELYGHLFGTNKKAYVEADINEVKIIGLSDRIKYRPLFICELDGKAYELKPNYIDINNENDVWFTRLYNEDDIVSDIEDYKQENADKIGKFFYGCDSKKNFIKVEILKVSGFNLYKCRNIKTDEIYDMPEDSIYFNANISSFISNHPDKLFVYNEFYKDSIGKEVEYIYNDEMICSGILNRFIPHNKTVKCVIENKNKQEMFLSLSDVNLENSDQWRKLKNALINGPTEEEYLFAKGPLIGGVYDCVIKFKKSKRKFNAECKVMDIQGKQYFCKILESGQQVILKKERISYGKYISSEKKKIKREVEATLYTGDYNKELLYATNTTSEKIRDRKNKGMCGVGLSKVCEILSESKDEYAELYKLALYAELNSYDAKHCSNYNERETMYANKERHIKALAKLCKEHNIKCGYMIEYTHMTNAIIYFDLPDCAQISFHMKLYDNELKTLLGRYDGKWDGFENSTLVKLEDVIYKRYFKED